MFPTEIYHYIVSKMDGFERENMRLVCKMFNGFKFIISSKNPARDREVLLIDCNRRFYELFEYGHLDIIKQCYRRYGNYREIIAYSCRYGFTDFAKCVYDIDHKYDKFAISRFLSKAVMSGNMDTVKMVVGMGDCYFDIVATVACKNGNIPIFKYILSLMNIWPIMDEFIGAACLSGNIDMVRLIITYPVKYRSSWDMGLRSACRNGNMDIINLMIENGANDWNGGFRGACEGGHLDIAKLMIAYGATSILDIMPTCRGGNIDILKMQIEMGANNFNDGFSSAIHNGCFEIVKILVSRDDVNIEYSLYDISKNTGIEIIELLIDNGAKISNSILKYAIHTEDLNIVKLIAGYMARMSRNIKKFYHSDRRIMKYLESY